MILVKGHTMSDPPTRPCSDPDRPADGLDLLILMLVAWMLPIGVYAFAQVTYALVVMAPIWAKALTVILILLAWWVDRRT